jgi:peroxiredoxin 2/4
MSLIGKNAPDITAQAVIDNQIKEIKLSDFADTYKILFFYPLDFSFVCPTEIHAFQDALAEFAKRNAVVLGVSVDSVYSHQAWLNQSKEKGGIQGVQFPLLSDITKVISQAYDVLNQETGSTYRATFIINAQNIIQHIQLNNMSVGRHIPEILRTLDAIQFTEKHGQVCPANWLSGQEGLSKTQASVAAYMAKK